MFDTTHAHIARRLNDDLDVHVHTCTMHTDMHTSDVHLTDVHDAHDVCIASYRTTYGEDGVVCAHVA